MGMRQRLAIAAALLGDPEVLILDEPSNGLDPPGIRWVRDLLRAEAGRGRAVLVSSHLLSEVALSADDVVVISRGILRASGPLDEVLGAEGESATRVRSPELERLAAALADAGRAVERQGADALVVPGAKPDEVGRLAAREGIALRELVAAGRSLEDAFLELTAEAA
jgi:ABC-2 type transport system ATP-binding protein